SFCVGCIVADLDVCGERDAACDAFNGKVTGDVVVVTSIIGGSEFFSVSDFEISGGELFNAEEVIAFQVTDESAVFIGVFQVQTNDGVHINNKFTTHEVSTGRVEGTLTYGDGTVV